RMDSVYVLVGRDRRGISDHGQSWDRSVDCAALVGGAGAEAIGFGATGERGRRVITVWAVSDGRYHAVGLLPGAVGDVWETRPDLSDVYCATDAAWRVRVVDCGDSGGGHVEPECGAELAVIECNHGFLCAASAP